MYAHHMGIEITEIKRDHFRALTFLSGSWLKQP